MPWHALESLDDAFEATREFLLPFSLRRWLTLAIVAFFVSGTTAFEPSPSFSLGDGGTGPEPTPPGVTPPGDSGVGFLPGQLSPSQLQLLVVVAAGALILGVLLAYVATVLEFVFVDIVRERDVRIRGRFGRYTDTGASLFLFRVAIGVILVATALTVVALVILTGGLFVIVLVLFSPALLLVGVGLWLLLSFTADFVVPVMIAEGTGVLDGWRAFWPELRADWRQYGAYALARLVLGGIGGVVVAIGFVTAAVVLGIPFGIVGIGALFVLGEVLGLQVIAVAVAAVVALLFVLCVVVVGTTLVQVPVQTYLRYYSLLVLGAITPSYDLVEDVRTELADAPEEPER